jgi:hypothetical protein
MGQSLEPAVRLLALENEGDRLLLRPDDADGHGAVRGKGIAFDGSRAGLRGRHLQNVVIPLGLGLEVFAGVNGRAVLTAGTVALEERLGRAFI